MDWDELKRRVEAEHVMTTTMEILRDAQGAGKLGTKVNMAISKQLAQRGIGHVPVDLPLSQSDSVRLYHQGTAVADLIAAVLIPGETNDTKLKDYADPEGAGYAEIIAQIRELVEE